MGVIDRIYYKKRADNLLKNYPVLSILGPRQCGKTTFAQTHFSNFEYLDLELPSDFNKLQSEPELYLKSRTNSLIIDEAQRLPEIFPIIRALVDQKRKTNSRFVLLGSASYQLHTQITESLSGRTAFLDFSTLSLQEVYKDVDLQAHWLKGGYPDALLQGEHRELNWDWFEFYTRTLIERDLPSLGIEIDSLEFRRLWTMCAQFHGNLINMNKIASAMGVSPHTIKRYISILEQCYIVRKILPYHSNIKKRLVRSPKIYFRDSGLFHYFQRIQSTDALLTSVERGNSFEGYAIEQILFNLSSDIEHFFFRTSDGIETDLLLKKGKTIVPIEIKAKLSASEEDIKNLIKTMSLLNCKKGYLLNLGDDQYPLTKNIVVVGMGSWIKNKMLPFWENDFS